jgi:hypothetical protein
MLASSINAFNEAAKAWRDAAAASSSRPTGFASSNAELNGGRRPSV